MRRSILYPTVEYMQRWVLHIIRRPWSTASTTLAVPRSLNFFHQKSLPLRHFPLPLSPLFFYTSQRNPFAPHSQTTHLERTPTTYIFVHPRFSQTGRTNCAAVPDELVS